MAGGGKESRRRLEGLVEIPCLSRRVLGIKMRKSIADGGQVSEFLGGGYGAKALHELGDIRRESSWRFSPSRIATPAKT